MVDRRDRPPCHDDARQADRSHREGVRTRPQGAARRREDGRVRRLQVLCDRWEMLVDTTAPSKAPTRIAPPRGAPEAVVRRDVVRQDHTRPDLGRDRQHHAGDHRAELFEADWAAAKERLGRQPTILDLDRTPAQRRADALVEMAIRARTARPTAAARPRFQRAGRLRDLRRSAARAVQPHRHHARHRGAWLTEADIERVVFDALPRHRRRRRAPLLPGRPPPAIEVRDRRCFHPCCDEVPLRPEIDHIDEAARAALPPRSTAARLRLPQPWRNHHPDDEWDRHPTRRPRRRPRPTGSPLTRSRPPKSQDPPDEVEPRAQES